MRKRGAFPLGESSIVSYTVQITNLMKQEGIMEEAMLMTSNSSGKKTFCGLAICLMAIFSLTCTSGCGLSKDDRALMQQSLQAAEQSKAAAARAEAASKRLEDVAARLETAARKAEEAAAAAAEAANRADAATNRATDAASRTEATAKKTERMFEKSLRK